MNKMVNFPTKTRQTPITCSPVTSPSPEAVYLPPFAYKARSHISINKLSSLFYLFQRHNIRTFYTLYINIVWWAFFIIHLTYSKVCTSFLTHLSAMASKLEPPRAFLRLGLDQVHFGYLIMVTYPITHDGARALLCYAIFMDWQLANRACTFIILFNVDVAYKSLHIP